MHGAPGFGEAAKQHGYGSGGLVAAGSEPAKRRRNRVKKHLAKKRNQLGGIGICVRHPRKCNGGLLTSWRRLKHRSIISISIAISYK